MSIKIEILADTPAELMLQLRGLIAGDVPVYTPASVAAASNALQAEINKAPAMLSEKPKRVRDRSKAALAAKAAGNGGGVKPLPADDDPLSIEDEIADGLADRVEEDDEEPFDAPTEANLLVTATDKLRDLFKANAKGVAGVRALREKYQVKFFHQVPVEKAQELWADALKLEAELAASA